MAVIADRHVASRIRARRKSLGISQKHFASMIGISHGQAQKWEAGLNRISVGRLSQIARALGVSSGWFYDELDINASNRPADANQQSRAELMRNFTLISNEKHQEALANMARALVDKTDEGVMSE